MICNSQKIEPQRIWHFLQVPQENSLGIAVISMAVKIPSEPSCTVSPHPNRFGATNSCREEASAFIPNLTLAPSAAVRKAQEVFSICLQGSHPHSIRSCAISGYKEMITCPTTHPRNPLRVGKSVAVLSKMPISIRQSSDLSYLKLTSIRVTPLGTCTESQRTETFLGATINVDFKLNLLT